MQPHRVPFPKPLSSLCALSQTFSPPKIFSREEIRVTKIFKSSTLSLLSQSLKVKPFRVQQCLHHCINLISKEGHRKEQEMLGEVRPGPPLPQLSCKAGPDRPPRLTGLLPHIPMHTERQRNYSKCGSGRTQCWPLVMETILESLSGRSGAQRLPSAQSFSARGSGFEYQHEELKIDAGRICRQKDYSAL